MMKTKMIFRLAVIGLSVSAGSAQAQKAVRAGKIVTMGASLMSPGVLPVTALGPAQAVPIGMPSLTPLLEPAVLIEEPLAAVRRAEERVSSRYAGVKFNSAEAMIKDGKVARWVMWFWGKPKAAEAAEPFPVSIRVVMDAKSLRARRGYREWRGKAMPELSSVPDLKPEDLPAIAQTLEDLKKTYPGAAFKSLKLAPILVVRRQPAEGGGELNTQEEAMTYLAAGRGASGQPLKVRVFSRNGEPVYPD